MPAPRPARANPRTSSPPRSQAPPRPESQHRYPGQGPAITPRAVNWGVALESSGSEALEDLRERARVLVQAAAGVGADARVLRARSVTRDRPHRQAGQAVGGRP